MDHSNTYSDYLFLFLFLFFFAEVSKWVIFLLLALFCNDILSTLMVTGREREKFTHWCNAEDRRQLCGGQTYHHHVTVVTLVLHLILILIFTVWWLSRFSFLHWHSSITSWWMKWMMEMIRTKSTLVLITCLVLLFLSLPWFLILIIFWWLKNWLGFFKLFISKPSAF